MMMTMTYNRRQGLSILLVLSMVFTMWMTVCPVNRADAGILSAVGGIAKSLFVNAGALAAGAMTAVVGAAVGGGPLGMAVGGIAGYFAAKKVLNWTTSSFANVATVAGAVAGGFLCAGMGFPMLAIGVVGGGLVTRLLVKGVGALISKITDGAPVMVGDSDFDASAAKKQNAAIEDYLNRIQGGEDDTIVTNTPTTPTTTPVASPATTTGVTMNSQTAYENYTKAYEKYIDCAQKGDSNGAKAAMEDYQLNLKLYQDLLKAGL